MHVSTRLPPFGLTVVVLRSTLAQFFRVLPRPMRHFTATPVLRYAVLLCVGLWWCACPASCQDSGDEGTISRGNRAELSITVHDASGGDILATPANVKLYQNGMLSDQFSTSHGRAFFIPRTLGDYTIVAEASGYKSVQKEVSLVIPVKAEIDIYLQRNLAANESAGVPGKPILAPKAQEALSKGIQALREGQLGDAAKYINEAVKLAPGNPDVLYVQGVFYMKQHNWDLAQAVLEKSDQIEPNQPRALAALGMALCNQRKYDQAIPPLEKSIRLEPASDWETDWALAKAYYHREEYDQALKMAESAHANARSSIPQVELLLAQCLSAAGRYGDSAQVLREFLKANPNDPDAATAKRWLDGLAANGKIH